MSISLGGVHLLPNVFTFLLGNGDLRSIFCLIVFAIVFLVLAYLTNPSENSFRAYLTEQSFRQHLSRLDEGTDDTISPNRPSPLSQPLSSVSYHVAGKLPSFHFANRASVSLRTPKHVFHSFAVFTVAAMVPLSKNTESSSREGPSIHNSWYIGAFGKWWRGGVFEEWYQDVITRSKDEESWSSGILSMKRLDMLQDYNAPTFSAKNLPAHLARGSPPKLRNREKPSLKNTSIHSRSNSPPPLPKSASLPMHSVRSVGRVSDSSQVRSPPHAQPCINGDSSLRVPAPPSRTPSTLFDQSPLIAEVLRQISSAKASVSELRAQLSECQTLAGQSRDVLQVEVDSHRDRKRQEDIAKLELKSRTKNLEDAKRGAEGLKKDADKRLKTAQTLRDDVTQGLASLEARSHELQHELEQNREFLSSHRNAVSDEEQEIASSLELKRGELKASEEQIHITNQRSRELEDKYAARKERLRIVREKLDNYHQQLNAPLFANRPVYYEPQDIWPIGSHPESDSVTPSSHDTNSHWHFTPNDRKLCHDNQQPHDYPSVSLGLPDPAYDHYMGDGSLDAHLGNDIVEKSGSNRGYFGQEYPAMNVSSEAPHGSNTDLTSMEGHWISSYTDETQLGSPISLSAPSLHSESTSDVLFTGYDQQTSPSNRQLTNRGNHWLSGLTARVTKNLNPEAREFSIFPSRLSTFGPNGHNTFDALNPHGLPSNTSTTRQSLLRAFAPSPAEREAFQRALGGSTNTSFERLPSLSDVGSIPASPTMPHATLAPISPQAFLQQSPAGVRRDFGSMLPAWLQSLPKSRKVNFSPWEDEEPAVGSKSQQV